MIHEVDLQSFDRDLKGFGDRVSALIAKRKALPDDAATVLDVSLEELRLAEAELQACRDELAARSDELVEGGGRADRERRSLRAAFKGLPVPVFLLNEAGAIRRANVMAARLLGVSSTHATGKPLPLFVDPRTRAEFRARLAAVTLGRGHTQFDTSLLCGGRERHVRATLSRVAVPGEDSRLVLAVVSALGGAETEEEHVADESIAEEVAVAAAQRLDLLLGMTRLLLDEESLREPVAMLRAARLLAAEFADWAVIDVVRGGELRRAAVAASSADHSAKGIRTLEQLGPKEGDVPHGVAQTARSVLQPVIEDDEALGVAPDGLPVLTALQGGGKNTGVSLMCVPLHKDEESFGALTLVRKSGRARFDLSDLALMEELGQHLALALQTERSYQRRYEIAEALQASLLPGTLPSIEGLEIAAVYRAAASGVDVGGDFYDVFDCPGGWGFVLGDVCGKGEAAAAVTARVREGVRLLGLSVDDPAEVLRQVNHAMVARKDSDRFVTAVFAWVRRTPTGVRVRLTSVGHPPAAILRADGTVRFGSGGGRPMGVLDDVRPDSEDLDLAAGDLLLLYSDGATEALAGNGELFGTDGLSNVLARSRGLPAADVLKAVEEDLHSHDGGHTRDDVALLAIRVAGQKS